MQKQQIHFVTGKGGVGKSFFAAAFAQALAQKSKFTPEQKAAIKGAIKPILLAEFNDHSFYREYLGHKPNDFDLAQWTGGDCLKEYAIYLLKIESLYKLFFGNPVTKALIDISPGLLELAILGRATSYPRKHGPPLKYNHMVFDAFATGHFLTMLRAPSGLAKIINFGPMGEQSRSIDEWIRNPEFCHIHLVSLPEELPATETVELYETIKKEFGIISKVYLNKYLFLKKEDLKNESESIRKHFTNLLEQQELAEKIFAENKIKPIFVPFIPEIETEKLLNEASNYILKEVL